MRRHSVGFAAVLLLLGLGSAHAGVVFSNFGPGDTYNTTSGTVLGGTNGYRAGDAFAVASSNDVVLESIELAVFLSGGPNELDIALSADASGLPGAVIESFHFGNAMGSYGNLNPPLLASSVLHPILQLGTQYWVVSVPSGSGNPNSTTAFWNWNSTGDVGPHATALGAVPWQVGNQLRGALRISGAEVPEPGSALVWSLLAALGVAACCRPWAIRGAKGVRRAGSASA